MSPKLAVPLVTPVTLILAPTIYDYVILFQLVGLFGWAVVGYWYYSECPLVLTALLVTIPLIASIHSAGAFWAIFQPTTNFGVTQKVPLVDVEDSRIAEGAVTARDTYFEQTTEETKPVKPR
ncbi:hypothetical protein GCM10008995_28080 [Halobellus salinus]|uniref:Uncharacterized protein n=1 Tax=Halobellus salinus TaxID=931585 RepID=A0A830ELA0_9EURY|nr:hypothetical protein [Halobellus salinus]GGJ16584.1 hypothetical protein GCM10008995_28080 [Halobellus salinus]